MRIHDRLAFALGLFFAGALLLFTFGIVSAHWWQWALALLLAGRYLYLGLSEAAGKEAQAVRQRYRETALRLFGPLAPVKTRLPAVLLAVFFAVTLPLCALSDRTLPVGVAVTFCMVLTVSAAYSIGLDRAIRAAIREELEHQEETEPQDEV